jgi:hypothetical protein
MNHESVNVIVFSLSTALTEVVSLINKCTNSHPFLCVSTHKLYDLEEERILESVQHNVNFKCFADFLTDEEMSWCDSFVYENEEELSEEKSLSRYYDHIKEEKNKLVFNNICKQYQLIDKYLCARDLGIDKSVWLAAGFVSSFEQDQQPVNVDSFLCKQKKSRNPLFLYLRYFKMFLNSLKENYRNIFILETSVGNYIFLGSIVRIRPYLDCIDIQQIQKYFFAKLSDALLTMLSLLSNRRVIDIGAEVRNRAIKSYATKFGISTILSTFHEYSESFSEIAKHHNMDFALLQDGYLPENYSSKYLYYYSGVNKFYTWDRLSLGLFENQKLKAEVCPFLYIPQLPTIEKEHYEIKTMLVLTSGAGDWTALKNRSDEDQMVIVFTRIAEHFPEIQIIYRCHPLWAHPAHQGIDSIRRVDRYFNEKGIKNIKVSEESHTLSQQFIKTHILGFQHSSLERDLEAADLIFGEHSFTMIEGTQKGKLFAAVNVTKRRDFFINYSKLGFHHLTSFDDVVTFIKELRISPGRILEQHNEAVQRYNNEWHR